MCSTIFVLVRLPLSFFVCVRHNTQGNLAYRTTKAENTHLTLRAIPFYVEVNNSYFCKRTKISKIFANTRAQSRSLATKNKSPVTLKCVKPSTCCVMCVSLRGNTLTGAFRSCFATYSRFVNYCILKICDWIVISMFHFVNGVTFIRFPHILLFHLFACRN